MDTPADAPPPASPPTRSNSSWWGLLALLVLVWGGSTAIQLWRQQGQGEAVRQAHPEGRITLYTSASCSYCVQAKSWLKDERVPYTDCPVDRDTDCAERFRRMGEPGTPVVQVDDDQFRLGFDATWLAQALNRPALR
jgi:glutaredoxin